ESMHRLKSLPLLAAIITFACAPTPPPGPTAPASGAPSMPTERRARNQILQVGKTGLPLNASPESSALNNDVMGTAFDSVLRFGPGFAYRPGVAERWELQAAENTWRLTIRRDLVFSNGERLTAEDVAYTLNTIVVQRWPQFANISLVSRAIARDEVTIDVQTRSLDAMLPNALPSIFVVPATYHAANPAEFGLRPVGSGPYELVEYRPADRAVYRLRPGYRHPYRTPTVTEIHFFAIPDLGQQLNGLRGGELDLVSGTFPVDQVESLRAAGYPLLVQSAGVSAAQFLQPEMDYFNSPVKDLRVRQALNYAINRQAIAESFYRSYSEPASQIADKNAPYYDPSRKPYPYDPAKAKQLLAAAGYPNGFALSGGIVFSSLNSNPALVTAMQGMFREIGVEVPVRQMEQAAFTALMLGGQGPRGDLSMLQIADALGSFAQLPNLFDCSREGFARRWCNPEFDRLFVASKGEPDPSKRNDLLRQALAVIDADVPYVLQVTVPHFTLTNPKIRGFEWPTRSFYDFDGVYRVE
ncbi:MAG: ABC transporter substrate-binding protein, partial [Chloroflexi bacterium]|nr:ABC transporter substrate-binding protein [Chloroflexota bacterium]